MKINLKDVVSVILAGGKGERLGGLTRHRTKPAVPFGGTYRIIDFTLSNCINSGLRRMLVLIQYKCLSLMRHLRQGWGFLSYTLGEYIEFVPPQQRVGMMWYRGTADAIFQNIYTLKKERPVDVLILAGDHIYKMDYRDILQFHRRHKADVTVGVVRVPASKCSDYGILYTDADHNIVKFEEKPVTAQVLEDDPEHLYASMGIYVFNAQSLYEILGADADNERSSHDFGKDIIPSIINKYVVKGFRFQDANNEPKYWRDVGTIRAYYDANMDLIRITPELNLYDGEWPLRTTPNHYPPPKFVFADLDKPEIRAGVALDSMISPGCVISGGRVERSILSPLVRVNSYSDVRNSIIMEGVNIGRYAKIKNAIIDKGVNIPERATIGYDSAEDSRLYTLSDDGIVVIPRAEQY